MPIPSLTHECIKLDNGLYIIRVYSVTNITIGSSTLPEGRTLTDVKAYPTQKAMLADLKAMLG